MVSKRPDDNRPETKTAADRRQAQRGMTGFGPLFTGLLTTRAQYEALRISGGSFLERSMLLDRLHELRADMAYHHRNLR